MTVMTALRVGRSKNRGQGFVFGMVGRFVNVGVMIVCGETQTLKLRQRSRNDIAMVASDCPFKNPTNRSAYLKECSVISRRSEHYSYT